MVFSQKNTKSHTNMLKDVERRKETWKDTKTQKNAIEHEIPHKDAKRREKTQRDIERHQKTQTVSSNVYVWLVGNSNE